MSTPKQGRTAVIAGATGFIATAVAAQLRAEGWTVIRLVRRTPLGANEVQWDPASGELDPSVLSGVDAVINMAGASIGKMPWTAAWKREIMDSRVQTTGTLARAMASAEVAPAVFLSASGTGSYGNRGDEGLDENSERSDGYLADVVVAWEAAAQPAIDAGIRTVFLRTGIVLGDGGALSPLRLATNLGAAARVGRGSQWWPWISMTDEVRAIVHLIDSRLAGPVNLVGPTPATSETITRALARSLKRPHLFVIPEFVVRAGFGQGGVELLLWSQKVTPAALQSDGFEFTHTTAGAALDSL
ncbi:MAG: hypothetical protein RL431_758 [Actinomycetota bacterium]|jgi:uncharacterized protein (TIGR01777 family)